MEKIKGLELNPRNELIKELADTEWVKNPLIYSQISGDFTPMQTNVMVELVNTLQDKINDYFKDNKTADYVYFTSARGLYKKLQEPPYEVDNLYDFLTGEDYDFEGEDEYELQQVY